MLSQVSSRFTTIQNYLLLYLCREWVTSVVTGIQPLHNNLELFIVISMQRAGYLCCHGHPAASQQSRTLYCCIYAESGCVVTGILPLYNNIELSDVVCRLLVLSRVSSRITTIQNSLLLYLCREWVTSVVTGIQPLHNNLELLIVISMQRAGYLCCHGHPAASQQSRTLYCCIYAESGCVVTGILPLYNNIELSDVVSRLLVLSRVSSRCTTIQNSLLLYLGYQCCNGYPAIVQQSRTLCCCIQVTCVMCIQPLHNNLELSGVVLYLGYQFCHCYPAASQQPRALCRCIQVTSFVTGIPLIQNNLEFCTVHLE